MFCKYRAEVWWIIARLASDVFSAISRQTSRETDGPGWTMPAVEVDIRANQRKLVASLCQLRQQFSKSHARHSRVDRRKRAAIFGQRFRLRVEQVDMRRAAAKP